MDGKEFIQAFGVGLSRVLRYTFGGVLLIVVIVVAKPDSAEKIKDVLGWELVVICTVILGAGIYAIHRGLIIPIHHLVGCVLIWASECVNYWFLVGEGKWYQRVFRTSKTERNDPLIYSLSPTRWLGSLRVPRFRRMLAYSKLRDEFFSEDVRTNLNIIHAEHSMIVMMSEALVVSAFFLCNYRLETLILGTGLFLFSAISGIQQHRIECACFKEDERRVREIIGTLTFRQDPN